MHEFAMMTLKLKLLAGLIGFVVMLGLLAYVASLPEHYREQGDVRTEKRINKEIDSKTEEYRKELLAQYEKQKQEDALKVKEKINAYNQEVALIKSHADKSIGMYFNKARICANQLATKPEGNNSSSIHEATTTTELLPEPYGRNIKELMVEADLIVSSYRGLQKVVKEKSCLVVVPDTEK
jgi:hypothetical protein